MNRKLALAAIVLGILVIAVVAIDIMPWNQDIVGVGSIKSIGLFCDTNYLNWGEVEPNSTTYKNVTFINIGNSPIRLLMGTSNWFPPEAANYMTVGWNYDNRILQPDETWIAQFSLYVSPSTANISNFAFKIIVQAERP